MVQGLRVIPQYLSLGFHKSFLLLLGFKISQLKKKNVGYQKRLIS